MKVLLADDEPLARALLRHLLAEAPGVEVVGEAGDGREAGERIAALDPDVLIIDIEMPEMDGMEAAGLLRGRGRPAVIFATAHTDRALDAFEIDAADYLLKPIRRERLAEALERVRRRLDRPSQSDLPLSELLPDDGIWVAVRQGQVRVPLSEVSHVTAAKDHVYLHLDGRTWMHRITMARLEALATPHGLVRIHRSAMVRPSRVTAVIHSGKSLKVQLDTGTTLPIGPAYRRLVRSWPA
ncbi:Transcriptional regulatory protein BtsR [Brevundimonas sp. NIBR10]|uniref:LytR/AlgR family response regulator transcription factor n=1 Tax=Brevundimonas sp. NIBR10 TaxID=3015997 RepID=UPI0022F1BAE4|nr:LytTR family DNA-binding domain-containing protein [Brevundimonas sp. NIBR10]WGM48925.1 Transcriptional regulatory protein BtsR [Brevundimonas sp. NIBR10]